MSMQTIGRASWILALVLALWGVRLILGRPLNWPWLPAVALPLALLAAAAFLATWPLSEQWPYWVGFGGYVGDFLIAMVPEAATCDPANAMSGRR